MEKSNMERVTIRLPRQQVEMLQLMVDVGDYPSVSEAIRAAIRKLIDERADRVMERLKELSEMA
ncbi:MAG: antitoxin ParD1/3/4 [Methanosarcinales archaeon]|nr:MAG: CopG-like domain-containing protein DNA-binding [Euryarchaeota archaeon 55_53]KUK30042.1 MAG: CopG-like domain-containing protein DNA-binding [Methanosarcinales archeaon 56_1174]MDI3488230.1 antitoxin ParD1/3/4 [Methanosarcinales archaeon]MDN5295022.1 antitoxin ParD1/3/4 [Methanosarcinales archaeon]